MAVVKQHFTRSGGGLADKRHVGSPTELSALGLPDLYRLLFRPIGDLLTTGFRGMG